MNPLVSIKQLFTWLCICPGDASSSKWKKRAWVSTAIVNFAVVLCHSAASLTLFMTFVSTDFGDLNMVYALTIAFILRHKVNEIFEQLSAIYSTSEYDFKFVQSSSKYAGCCQCMDFVFYPGGRINSIRFLARCYCEYVIGTIVSIIMMSISSVFFCWLFNGHYRADYVYHPLHVM